MFDIGFWELMIIAVMGLVVLGPERLPVAIRTIRGWIGGVRKFSDAVKSELSEELRIQELHGNLKKAEQGDMKNLSPEVAASVKSLKEAAALVNEPFKKVDTSAIDSLISTSLASKSTQSADSNTTEVELTDSNDISSKSQNQAQEQQLENKQ